ncbi:MAG: rhomboid family intramembrane serine protease [Flavobacteriales bacterium]|nr:rhomboid family intramembrane serine protease [Flavobacteriales bacterium]
MDELDTGIASGPLREERRMLYALIPPAFLVLILWSVFLLDLSYELDLFRYGLLPREAIGIRGVFTSPFLHGDIEHLINNSIPLLVLGTALLYFFPRLAGRVILVSWLVAGFCVWLTARGNYHIGASGVVYGLAAFLFTSGLLRKQRTLMGLSLLVVFLYGSFLWGVFPILPRISWESHFWGAASGVVMAVMYRDVPSAVKDPLPIEWDEDEDDEDEDLGNDGAAMPNAQGPAAWSSTDTWNIQGSERSEPCTPEA